MLALLITDFHTVWCPRHLEPYQAQWPLGAPAASMYLITAAAEKADPNRLAEPYDLLARLVALAPLCCYVGDREMFGIHWRTVPA